MWLPLQGNQITEATEAVKDTIKSVQPNKNEDFKSSSIDLHAQQH